MNYRSITSYIRLSKLPLFLLHNSQPPSVLWALGSYLNLLIVKEQIIWCEKNVNECLSHSLSTDNIPFRHLLHRSKPILITHQPKPQICPMWLTIHWETKENQVQDQHKELLVALLLGEPAVLIFLPLSGSPFTNAVHKTTVNILNSIYNAIMPFSHL